MFIKLLTLAVAIFTINGLQAQTFNTPVDSIVMNIDANGTAVLPIEQMVLNPNDTLQLEVRVTYNDIPAGWDGMLCVQGLCTGMLPAPGFVTPMAPIHSNLDGYARITLSPLGNTGTIKFRAYVYDENFPADGDTVTWILTSVDMTSIDEAASAAVSMYPNPTNGSIQLDGLGQDLSEIEIYNIQGQLILSQSNYLSNQPIDLTDLPSGNYIVLAKSKSELIRKKLVVK